MIPGRTPQIGLRRRALVAAAGLAASATWRPTAAQRTWPSQALRIVVPFTPGGSTDILARAIGQELHRTWGQPVVVDNVPGAGGSIGADRVAKAAADGYTLLMGHIGTLAVNPSLYPRLPYDPQKDLIPVAWVARVPNVLAVHASLPVRTFAEFVAYARSRPGQINYSSGGNGSAAHMATEYLKMRTQISLLHIPYRGTAPAVADVVAGQVQAIFSGVPAILPHIKSGKVRALAVSSPRRLALLPDVPAVAETGVEGARGFEADQWYGVVAPRGTAPDIVARLNEAINKALSSAEVASRLAAEGAEPTPATPQAFGQLIGTEIKRWAAVVQRANIRIDS